MFVLIWINMKKNRPYDMSRRSQLAEATRLRILEATIEQALAAPLVALTLPSVAERAKVSVQTVLRGFGSRDELIGEATRHGKNIIVAERTVVKGDIRASLAALANHYEKRGDGVLLLLGQEGWEPTAAAITTEGRAEHRRWVEDVFADALGSSDRRPELMDLLIVATDVYAWKLLRRDQGLSPEQTLARMTALVTLLIGGRSLL
jgi:AcrR family transcriptional regulator